METRRVRNLVYTDPTEQVTRAAMQRTLYPGVPEGTSVVVVRGVQTCAIWGPSCGVCSLHGPSCVASRIHSTSCVVSWTSGNNIVVVRRVQTSSLPNARREAPRHACDSCLRLRTDALIKKCNGCWLVRYCGHECQQRAAISCPYNWI